MTVLMLALLAVLLAGAPGNRAYASCNAVPDPPPGFCGTQGCIDRLFLVPGNDVVTIRPRDVSESSLNKDDVVITIIFKPPQDAPQTFFIAKDGEQCEKLEQPGCFLERLFCRRPHNCFTGREVDLDAKFVNGLPQITFRFPDTGVAGPVTIAVVTAAERGEKRERAEEKQLRIAATELSAKLRSQPCRGLSVPPNQHLAACLDQVEQVGGDSAGAAADPTLFGMPPANDFQALCTPPSDPNDPSNSPACLGTATEVVFALDRGDVLLPIDWTHILRHDSTGQAIRRDVRGSTAVEQVLAHGSPIYIPSSDFLSIPSGTTVSPTPVFVPAPQQPPHEQAFVGTADKDGSVLRFAQRVQWNRMCDSGLNESQACSTNSDCAPSASAPSPQCVPLTLPTYFACAGGPRDGKPCTRTRQCLPGSCRRVSDIGSWCVKFNGNPTGTPCTDDSICGRNAQCGPGVFEFRNRETTPGSGTVKLNRFATGSQGVCEKGPDAGKTCANASQCQDSANCVVFRAEALPYPTPPPP